MIRASFRCGCGPILSRESSSWVRRRAQRIERTDRHRSETQSHARAVGAEVAIAVVLLCAVALLIRSFVAMHEVSLGFDSCHMLTMEVSLAGAGYAKSPPGKIYDDVKLGIAFPVQAGQHAAQGKLRSLISESARHSKTHGHFKDALRITGRTRPDRRGDDVT